MPVPPGNQQPQIVTTAKGLPQVNIQAPSAAGVSRNVYSQFDVNAQGVILNNSRTNVQTQLGGWVQSNGNLAGGAARVILNEVNSSNPSQLKGFVEVAGQRAEVIIANPSGISVDGGGFINASGVTLTTGTPQINAGNGGSLDSFRVQQGAVTINGAGLDTSSADFTRILAHAAQVNAGIWAKDLRVVTGSNEVNATTHAATAIACTGAAPAFAIDVAALGGMYANKITLIGTEAGVGVNNAGTIAANGGDLVLSVNGMLTNRGTIDGGATHIDATTVNNLGTGKIYGDSVSISATTLNNDTETVAGTIRAGVIAARVGRLDIGAATVNNREHALLFSVGDLAIGGSLDANRQATGQAADVNNASATIEALGNVSIATNNLRNTNEHFAFEDRVTTVENELTINNTGSYYAVINRTTYDPVITENAPAKILAGGDINLDTTNALNRNSHIIAGGALNMAGAAITNEGTNGQHRVNDKGTSYTWTIVGQDCGWYNWSYRCSDRWDWRSAVYETNTYTTVTVSTGVSRNNTAPAGSGTTVPNSSLFRVATNTSYLVETDPRFTNQRTWLNSDFMLTSLNLDPSLVQKRLGDGFYEQRMVREQVAQLTGRRFLGDYTSDQQEYQALMQSGVTVAMAWNLRPGIALTAAQVAQLTADIVWLVEQEVTLPNGTKHMALVPQVYVRPQPGDLANTGALLAGKDVNLNLSGDLTNSGTIAGRRVVDLSAQNIQNLGGSIQGDTVAVKATTDINNTGGTLQAQSALSAIAGRDLNVGTTTASSSTQSGISDSQRTIVDRVAGLYVTGGNGTLLASAGRDVNILAGIIGNSALDGSTTILASNNLNLGTVTTASSDNINWDARNYRRASNTAEVGSQISSTGTTTLSAGNNLTARAANVQSAGDMRATAGNNINISAGQATAQLSTGAYAESSGLLSSSSTEVRSSSASTSAIASNFSATRITGDSGQDLTVKGSNLTASQDVVLTAGRDVTIESAQNTSASSQFSQKTQSGFSVDSMATLSVGERTSAQDASQRSTTQVASTVTGKNVNITSGRDVLVKGSQLTASQDVTLRAGQDLVIASAQNTSESSQSNRNTAAGFSIGSSGLLLGDTTQAAKGNTQSTTQVASTITGRNITAQAGRDATVQASKLLAEQNITLAAQRNTFIVAAANLANTTSQTNSNITSTILSMEDKTRADTRLSSTAVGSELVAGNKINIAIGNAALLSAAQLTAPSIAFTRAAGADTTTDAQLILDGAANTLQVSRTEKTDTLGLWQSATGAGKTEQTLTQTSLKGSTSFDPTLKISVTLPAGDLKTQLATLSSQPGMDYLAALAQRDDVNWQGVKLAHDKWDYAHDGLTPAGAMVVAAVVAYFTAGAGSAMVGTASTTTAATATTAAATTTTVGTTVLATTTAAGISYTAAGLAINAGFTALASQAAVAMINNHGDIGKTLDQLGKEESIKNLVFTMLTAGALGELNSTMGWKQIDASSSFNQQLLKNVTNNLASSAMDAAINGKPLTEDALANSLKSALLNTSMAQSAYAIGDAKAGGDINAFTSKFAHAALGCLSGNALGGGCSAGAVGALAGELAAQFINPNADPALAEKTIAFARTMASVAGVFVGGGGDNVQAVNAAAATGANAAENNWLGDHQKAAMTKEMRDAQTTLDKLKVAGKYLVISGKQDGLTATGIGMGLAEAGWSDVKGLAEFLQDPIKGLDGLQKLVIDPQTRKALGESVAMGLSDKIDSMRTSLSTGGDAAALQLGRDLGGLIWQVGSAVTVVGGVAEAGVKLTGAGVRVTALSLETLALRASVLDAGTIRYFKNADEINSLMSVYEKAPAWKASSQVVEATIKPGTRVQMVVDKAAYDMIMQEGKMNFVGNWASFDNIPSQAFARNNLAITKEFKTDVGYLVELEVVKPVNAQIGVVGAQGAASGGANQLNFLFEQRNGGEFFKLVDGRKLP
jgi:filamentous hemagglutinin family protein